MRTAALVLSALLCAPPPTWAALLPTESFLNVHVQPLAKPVENLLFRNRYQIRSDGTVWGPDGVTQIAAAQLPDILKRLGSNQRLKALVQIDLVLSNSAGERYLTASEREDVRKIARDNWPFFTLSLRKNFKSYFTAEELETMNRDPAPLSVAEQDAAPLQDMEPEIAYEPPPPLPYASAPVPRPVLRPAPVYLEPRVKEYSAPALPPVPTAALTPRPPVSILATMPATSPVPVAPPPVVTVSAPAPASPPPPVVKAAPPAPATIVTAVPGVPGAQSNPLEAALDEVSLSPAALAALSHPSAPVPVKIAPPAPVVVAAPPPPVVPPPVPKIEKPALPPEARDIMQAEFERWLVDAPYGREAKTMLLLISHKAPGFARSRALNAILSAMPMMVIDSERAQDDRFAAVIVDKQSSETGYTIALNPGPVFFTKKRMFFGARTILMSDSAGAFNAMKVPAPELDALKRDAAALKEEQDDWGRTRTYADGSTRSYYTYQQMAGTLLREVLLLDARRQGWIASRYAAEVYARSAQNMLYARLSLELSDDRFLDPETRAQFHMWLSHPRDWHDELAHTLTASRGVAASTHLAAPESSAEYISQSASSCPGTLDQELSRQEIARRHALKTSAADLRELDLIGKSQLEAAAKAVDAEPAPPVPARQICTTYWQETAVSLGMAAGLLSELRVGEMRFREELTSHAK